MPLAFALLVLVCFSSSPAFGQAYWNGSDGNNWLDAGNWSGGMPDSGTDAFINSTTNNPVLLNGSASVRDLTLLYPTNALTIGLGSQLNVYGDSISNGGTILLTAGSGNDASLNLQTSTTLSGGSVVNLDSGNNNGRAIIAGGSGVTFTNADNWIQGYGDIGNGGMAFINQYIVNANTLGQALNLAGGGLVTNQQTLEASGGGTLGIYNAVNNSSGTIAADAGNVLVYNTTISGGNLNTFNGGTTGVVNGAWATLDGSSQGALTLYSDSNSWTGNLGSHTYTQGAINNNGNIQLNAGNGSDTWLGLNADTSLQGGGSITLNSGNYTGHVSLYQTGSGITLTNVDHTIQGYGEIGYNGLSVVNQAAGTISANVGGQSLSLDGGGPITNQGLLEGTNGGTLWIANSVNNLGGNITADNGTVQIANATIQGGTLNSLNGGAVGVPGGYSAVLDGSSQGALTLYSDRWDTNSWTGNPGSDTYMQGAINNNGNIQLSGGYGANTYLGFNADTTLQGGGTITMDSGNYADHVSLWQNGSGITLTNVDHAILGSGEIGYNGLALVNEADGFIDANVNGSSLFLDGGGAVTNAGYLYAENGGILQIRNTVNNAGGNITADYGTVYVNSGGTIQGGTLNSLDGGWLGVNSGGTAYLDGSTQGSLTLSSGSTWTSDLGSTTYVQGTFNNQGNIQINAGNGYNTYFLLTGNTTLQGGGAMTLNSGNSGGLDFVYQATGGLTLTNVNNTIQGYGVIGDNGLALVNQAGGTINANASGYSLILNGGGLITNAGLLEATNGGVLQIQDTVANQGGNITANGGTVYVNAGGTVQGGTLNTLNGGLLGVSNNSTAYLDGSTAQGAITISPGSTWTSGYGSATYVQGTFNNQGNIQINGGNGQNTNFELNGNTTLQGGGTMTLNSGNGEAYVYQSTGGLTLNNVNNTIQGYGVIGENGLTLVNQAGGTINANAPGYSLVLNGGGLITNSGLLEATNGGVLQIENVVANQGGNITANGGTVSVNAGGTIQGGTLNSLNGGWLGVNNGGTAVLDGSTSQGAITISPGSTWTSGNGSNTYVQGTFNNQGNIQINGGNGYNTYFLLTGNTTLQGGGAMTLKSGDSGGRAYVYQTAGGTTLNNVNNTIQGYGEIGVNGLSVVNGAAGTILANTPGRNLYIDGSGTLTNNGTLQANAGSALVVTQNLANFSGNTLTGGTYFANNGTLQFNLGSNTGGEIVNNAANIHLFGADSSFVDEYSNNALSNLSNNAGTGSFTVDGGAAFDASDTGFTNAGAVLVGAGSSFSTLGEYDQTGGTTQDDGTITATLLNILGGTLSGTGTVNGDVNIGPGGKLSPGDSPGTIAINGNYSQAGLLYEELGGTPGSGLFDFTNIDLSAAIGGTLDIDLVNGFAPGVNAHYVYDILYAFGGVSGTFGTVNFLNLPSGDTYSVDYSNPNYVILDLNGKPQGGGAVPEPSFFLPLAGLFAVAGFKFRGRRGNAVA
jgi:hypothetical protein